MKKGLLFIVLLASAAFVNAQTQTFHDFSGRDIEGINVDFSDYHGKKVMVVNTASFCAFTPQYEDLQDLYEQYQQYDFEIVGFPCNDFDNQDPGSDSTILEFCTDVYGITFQMMSKVFVVEPDTAPVFRWLQEEELNGVADAPVTWNFHKFLIDEAGHWVAHHGSTVSPTASSITDWIMSPSALGVDDLLNGSEANLVQLVSATDASLVELLVTQTGTERSEIQLYSADGRLVDVIHTGKVSEGQRLTYNASGLNAGIYLIRATTSNGQQALRYVVGK